MPASLLNRMRVLLLIAAAYLVLVALVLLQIVPSWPTSRSGWALLLIFGPPLYLFLGWLGEKFTEPWGERNTLMKIGKAALLIAGFMVFLFALAIFRHP